VVLSVVRTVSRPLAGLLLAGAAISVAASAAAQSPSTQQPSGSGGLVLPGQVQTAPGSGSPAAGTVAPRPQAPAAQQAPAQQPAAQPRPAAPQGQQAPAAAQARPPSQPGSPTGEWQIQPEVYSDGSFKMCVTGNEFDNGLHLLFMQNPEKKTNLVLGIPGGRMPPGQRLEAKVSVDSSVSRTRPGVVTQPDAIVVALDSDPELIKAIGTGSVLTVEVPGDAAKFRLRGTSKAMADLTTCVDESLAGKRQMPTPPPVMPPSLARMLVQAGLQDAKAIPIDKIPPEQRPGDYAWQLGNQVIGSIRGFPVGPDAGDMAAVTDRYLEQLQKSCGGTFDKKPANVEDLKNFDVRTVTATCQQGEQNLHVSLVFQLLQLPKREGQQQELRLLNVFTHEGPAAESQVADNAAAGIAKALRELGNQQPTAPAAGAAPAGAPKPQGQ